MSMNTLTRTLCNDPIYQSLPSRPRWDDDIKRAVHDVNFTIPYGSLRAAARDMLLFQKIWERLAVYGACVVLMEGEK